jgi:hypothetical protein
MNASSSLVTDPCKVPTYVQMVLFTGIPLPIDPEPVPEVLLIDPLGDVSRHPVLALKFDIPVLVHRSIVDLLRFLPQTYSNLHLDKECYEIDHSNRKAKFHIFPLDNTPVRGSSERTFFREARASQKKFWRDGRFAPIDWFVFVEMIDTQNGRDVSFIEEIRARYSGRYTKVVILFTDPIRLGVSQEDYYLVWESVGEFNGGIFGVVTGDIFLSLFNGETIITVCVEREEVITNPKLDLSVTAGPIHKEQNQHGRSQVCSINGVDYQSTIDFRYVKGEPTEWDKLFKEHCQVRPRSKG